MNLAQRLEAQIGKFPADLHALFDAEIAAGNELRDVEVGRGPDEGKVAIVLYKPFFTKPAALAYREDKDRDPMLFGYFSADDRFAVLWVKFKPMVLDKSFHGPSPPTPQPQPQPIEQTPAPTEVNKPKRTAQRARENARARKQSPKKAGASVGSPKPSPARKSEPAPKFGDAGKRFLDSMTMTFDRWHDGEGYDLEAIDQVPDNERTAIEAILIGHQPRDCRDIEALARFDTDAARAAIEEALTDPVPSVRREAMRYAGEKADPTEREKLLLKSLKGDGLYSGLSQAIDEAEEFHPPAVIDALFRGALNRDGEAAVHFAALLFFLHGKSKEAFDWAHRPFFLRFNTTDHTERKAAFLELCETVGVDPKKYMR